MIPAMPMQIIAGGGPSLEALGEDSGAEEDEPCCEDSPMGAELAIIIDHQALEKNSKARDMSVVLMCILGWVGGFDEIRKERKDVFF